MTSLPEAQGANLDLGQVEARVIPLTRPSSGSSTHATGGTQHKLNGLLGWGLLLVLALAPIPLASNRPVFWCLWAIVVGTIGMLYFSRLWTLDVAARMPLGRMPLEALLFFTFIAFAIAQIIPLGGLLAPFNQIKLLDGTVVGTPTLSLDSGSSLYALMTFLTYGVFYLLFAQVVVNRSRARFMVRALFIVISLFAVYALVSLTQLGDTLLGFEKVAYQGYATGTFVNRNSFATFLAVGATLGVTILLDTLTVQGRRTLAQRWSAAIACLMGLAFIGAALFATGSRMGVFVGLAGSLAVVVGWVFAGNGRKQLKLLLGLALLLLAGAIVGIMAFGETLLTRLIFVRDEAGRGQLYDQIIPLIRDRLWFGHGGGSFATVFPAFQRLPLSADVVFDNAHSTYLALWFEYGVIAGSIPLVIIALLAARAMRNLTQPDNSLAAIASLGVTIVFAIHSLVDFSAEMQANALLFCATLALGAAGTRVKAHG